MTFEGFSWSADLGVFSSSVSGLVNAAMISSRTSLMPSLTFSVIVVWPGIDSTTIRMLGIPLTDADVLASSRKPFSIIPAAGLFLSSMATTSYARYLVQPPQSPTAATTASTPFSQSSNLSLYFESFCCLGGPNAGPVSCGEI